MARWLLGFWVWLQDNYSKILFYVLQNLIVSCVYLFTEYQAHSAIDQTAYMDPRKKYHKTTHISLPEDEHLDVRNMSKTL